MKFQITIDFANLEYRRKLTVLAKKSGLSLKKYIAKNCDVTQSTLKAGLKTRNAIRISFDTVVFKGGNYYVGYVEGIPGAHAQARTLRKLKSDVVEVTQMMLE